MVMIPHFIGKCYGIYHHLIQITPAIILIIFVLSTYFDTRSEKEGLHRNDWENWNYRAMKVMQHIIIYIC